MVRIYVLFTRCIRSNCEILIHLLYAKTRISSINHISYRLELFDALLLAQCMKKLINVLYINKHKLYYRMSRRNYFWVFISFKNLQKNYYIISFQPSITFILRTSNFWTFKQYIVCKTIPSFWSFSLGQTFIEYHF